MSRDRDEAEDVGAPKTEPRDAWLTGDFMKTMVTTVLGGCVGGAFALGVGWATVKSDIAANTAATAKAQTTGDHAETLAIANQVGFRREIHGLKISVGMRFAASNAARLKEHGSIQASLVGLATDLKWMKVRAEEESRRAPGWRRDERQIRPRQ